jgi:osmoprotectant transport system substrate-binding protein
MKIMKEKLKIVLLAVLALSLIGGLSACKTQSPSGEDSANNGDPVRVGSKNFTESLILGNLYADALEDQGIPVERKLNLAGTVVHTSIVNDEIDLYPEYTGTGLLSVLKLPLETDAQKVYDTVKQDYEEQWNIIWLDYAPANDSQGLAITKKASVAYGITTISQLQQNADKLRFATQGEFDQREDGLPGLEKVYGAFKWKSSKTYDVSLLATVLLNDEADVAPLYTTAGDLASPKLIALEDDKHVWPPYNVAPVIRNNALKAYPQIAAILNAVNKTLTTEKLTELNAKVDVDKEEADKVASDYYESIKSQVDAAVK